MPLLNYPIKFDENAIENLSNGRKRFANLIYAMVDFNNFFNDGNAEGHKNFLNEIGKFSSNYLIVGENGRGWNENGNGLNSGFQGLAISLLLRAFELKGNLEYAEIAYYALIPFNMETSKGGLKNTDGAPFKGNLIDNLIAFISFYEHIISTRNKNATDLFNDNIGNFSRYIYNYEKNGWIYLNDLKTEIISPQGINVISSFLRYLSKVSDIELFSKKSDEWEKISSKKMKYQTILLEHKIRKLLGKY